MVFSQRFSYDDKQFLRLLNIIANVLRFNSGLMGQVSGCEKSEYDGLIKKYKWTHWILKEVILKKNLWNDCSNMLMLIPEKQSCSLLCAFLPQMYNVFPWLVEHLPGPQHSVFAQIKGLRDFVEKKIQEHKETLDPSSPRDYIDCFLIRMNQVGINFRIICFVKGTLPHPLCFMLKLLFVC